MKVAEPECAVFPNYYAGAYTSDMRRPHDDFAAGLVHLHSRLAAAGPCAGTPVEPAQGDRRRVSGKGGRRAATDVRQPGREASVVASGGGR